MAKNDASARPASRSHGVSRSSARDWIVSFERGPVLDLAREVERVVCVISALTRGHADATRGSRELGSGARNHRNGARPS